MYCRPWGGEGFTYCTVGYGVGEVLHTANYEVVSLTAGQGEKFNIMQ